jgi:hypothetical protein
MNASNRCPGFHQLLSVSSSLQDVACEIEQFAGAADRAGSVLAGYVEEAVVGLVLESDESLEVLRSGFAAWRDLAQEDGRRLESGSWLYSAPLQWIDPA